MTFDRIFWYEYYTEKKITCKWLVPTHCCVCHMFYDQNFTANLKKGNNPFFFLFQVMETSNEFFCLIINNLSAAFIYNFLQRKCNSINILGNTLKMMCIPGSSREKHIKIYYHCFDMDHCAGLQIRWWSYYGISISSIASSCQWSERKSSVCDSQLKRSWRYCKSLIKHQ